MDHGAIGRLEKTAPGPHPGVPKYGTLLRLGGWRLFRPTLLNLRDFDYFCVRMDMQGPLTCSEMRIAARPSRYRGARPVRLGGMTQLIRSV